MSYAWRRPFKSVQNIKVIKDYTIRYNPSPLYHLVITSAVRKCVSAEAGNASRVSRTSANMAELRRLDAPPSGFYFENVLKCCQYDRNLVPL